MIFSPFIDEETQSQKGEVAFRGDKSKWQSQIQTLQSDPRVWSLNQSLCIYTPTPTPTL